MKDPLVKPFLKWAGGKRQLLSHILPEVPNKFDCYYEPFLGAGAVLFALQPKRAVVNDNNEQLIATYLAIRDDLKSLLELLKEHKAKNSEKYYYSVREHDRSSKGFQKLSPTEKAARFIYLNKTCYNGLYRVNSKGAYNVPFGQNLNPHIVEEPALKAVNNYLNSSDITFVRTDFSDSVKKATDGDFVYFDPPYHTETTNFTGYSSNGFTAEDQKRLAKLYDKLSGQNIRSVLSNSDTEFVRSLYSKHVIKTILANRTINSVAKGRGKVNELLIKNY